MSSYDAIAIDIPEKVWLENVTMYSDLTAYIKGYSFSVKDVVNYHQSLQKLSKFKDLKITSLKLAGDKDETEKNDEDVKVENKKEKKKKRRFAKTSFFDRWK